MLHYETVKERIGHALHHCRMTGETTIVYTIAGRVDSVFCKHDRGNVYRHMPDGRKELWRERTF